MADLGLVGEIDGAAWRSELGLAAEEQPVAVIVEGTWWRDEHTRRRLSLLESTRELGIPGIHLGRHAGREVLYACPYGAAATAEVVHLGVRAGVSLAVQIGSCGVVGQGIRPGDVVVPTTVLGLDGVAHHYSPADPIEASGEWSERARDSLQRQGTTVHRGSSVTWPTLFNQPLARVREWRDAGYLGVDMETATTLAVAKAFGVPAISMLVAWDEILSGRSFLDPLPDDQAAAFSAADEATFRAALELIDRSPQTSDTPGGSSP
jgi:uridine phosphorylase